MPEDTSKLLGLIEDLAIIAEDAASADGVLNITIRKPLSEGECTVYIQLRSLDKLKRHYPGKVNTKDHSDLYNKESIILFDDVEVFCLNEKPQPELDINVVPLQEAI